MPCLYQATMVSDGPDTEQLSRKSFPSSWNTTSGGVFTNLGGSERKGELLHIGNLDSICNNLLLPWSKDVQMSTQGNTFKRERNISWSSPLPHPYILPPRFRLLLPSQTQTFLTSISMWNQDIVTTWLWQSQPSTYTPTWHTYRSLHIILPL